MNLELKGTVQFIGKAIDVSPTFTKRELWIEIDQDSDYPQTISVEFIKDKCSLLDKFSVGDQITVDTNVRGNKATLKDGTERVFNQLNGWRVSGEASGSAPTGNASTAASAPTDSTQEADDLPF